MSHIELSIVVPTFNRCAQLRECLEALGRQLDAGPGFEVVVVVDGSTDDTLSMLESLRTPFPLQVVRQENRGQAAALNRGIEEARGVYCLFIDDDIVAQSGLVKTHLEAQRARDNLVAAGQITLGLPLDADWYLRAFAAGWARHYEALNSGAATLAWEDCYSGNLSAPREALLRSGGFSTGLSRGLDVELAHRLAESGCTLAYLPGAIGCQQERKGFRELAHDAEQAGASDFVMYRDDPRKLSSALASFTALGWRKLLVQRVLLALRLPPWLLALPGRFIPTERQRESWHGLLQRLCYWRGVRRATRGTKLWAQLTSGTPILLYHALARPGEPASTFVMPAKRLTSHLKWVRRFGYRPISLEAFLDFHRDRRFPPARSVVITFDDGYLDNFDTARPILRALDVPAAIFLVSARLGQSNDWDRSGPLAGRRIMTPEQAMQLPADHISLGAHTRRHVRLTALPAPEAAAEIVGSREELEKLLRLPITTFAYPFGLHDAASRELVSASAFAAGLTVDPGLNSPSTPANELRRAEIEGTDNPFRLLLALWLGDPEALWRRPARRRGSSPAQGHGQSCSGA